MVEKLKACPFCGSLASIPYCTADAREVILCDDCGAEGPSARSDADAIAAWNCRSAGPRHPHPDQTSPMTVGQEMILSALEPDDLSAVKAELAEAIRERDEARARTQSPEADGDLLDQAVAFAEMWGTEQNWPHVRDAYVTAILRERAHTAPVVKTLPNYPEYDNARNK